MHRKLHTPGAVGSEEMYVFDDLLRRIVIASQHLEVESATVTWHKLLLFSGGLQDTGGGEASTGRLRVT